MNLWLRLVWFFTVAWWRKPLGFLEECVTSFFCWPLDLDIYAHMNNARYLNLMDIGRADLVIRCGLWNKLKAHKYFLVVEAQTIRYRKSVQLGDRFVIKTQVVGWNDKSFFLTQTFVRGHDVVAEALVKGRVLRRARGTVPPAEVLKLAGAEGAESPALNAFVAAWEENLGRPFSA